jgi:predicted ABC-type transport system involved in lysophospholipase L1 biosynthesis ATPase subunit
MKGVSLEVPVPLLKSLSVTENLLAPVWAKRTDPVMRDRAAELLAFVGATQIAVDPVEALSEEEQWRILVARALMPSPRLVLSDDPARSLDAESGITILDLLTAAHASLGFTLIVMIGRVAAASCCQRLITVADGAVADDVLVRDDDGWTRGRIDRIGGARAANLSGS